MPFDIGVPELLIVLFIIILIFGVGRIAPIGKEVGTAIRELRKGLKGDEAASKEPAKPEDENKPKG
jgi:sec-independent protein translocase protein TatA